MKFLFLRIVIPAFLVALLAFRMRERVQHTSPHYSTALRFKNIIRCSPDWDALKHWLEETDIPPIPGAGAYKWKISTNNDSAQFYFNQGINMYYSFHIIEAMASFKKAAKFDPQCGMLYWAQALAYGPNINDFGYAASPEALAATAKASALSGPATDLEKQLIQAMNVRYTADSTDVNRRQLNEKYTAAMEAVYQRFPNSSDAGTLYADALMLEHPWDLWNTDGTPKPWTPHIEEVLEKLLVLQPNNPGTNHYYIHVMEPSPFADKALACAERLGKLTPGLSHTVHMPSHIYLRTGYYEKGVAVNESAIKSYQRTIPLYAPVTGADFLYSIHNLHMQTDNAMLAGRSVYAITSAFSTRSSVPKDYLFVPGAFGNYAQYIYMTPVFAYVRFGKWNEMLQESAPEQSLVYANAIYHFGRGMAFAGKRQMAEARKELEQLQSLMKDSSLLAPMNPFSPAIDGARVAEQLLAGAIALGEKKYDAAIDNFKTAVTLEGNMVYNEPRDWLLSPKQYLGNALLQAGKNAEARKVLEQDLAYNKENGWSLYGCWLSLKENDRPAADRIMDRYKAAFHTADVKIFAPVY